MSQLPHVRMLCDNSLFRKHFEIVVFAHLNIESTGVKRFCEERSLPFFDLNFNFVDPASLTGLDAAFEILSTVFANQTGPGPNFARLGAGDTKSMFAEIAAEMSRQSNIARLISIILGYCELDIVLLFEDNAEHDTGIWMARARNSGIPSLIVPFTIADEIEPAESHYHDPLFWADATPLHQFAAEAYPAWTYRYRD